MEASHEDDDLFSLVNWTISTLLAAANLLWCSCLLLDMWPKCCDWDFVMLLLGMQWFLGYVKFEGGQKVLQYLDYGNHIIFLVVMMSMCSWHIRCTNASRIMWCIKRVSGMRHGEHHSYCKEITDVCNVSFGFFFQIAQIALWLGNWDIPLPFSSQHHNLIILLSIPCVWSLF
jgi:hypothetical protein